MKERGASPLPEDRVVDEQPQQLRTGQREERTREYEHPEAAQLETSTLGKHADHAHAIDVAESL